MLRRPIVTLKSYDLGAGKVPLEAKDVVDLGPAPAIDRLVVVPDAADVAGRGRQQPQPEVLGDIGVLIFIDQDVAKPTTIFLGNIRMFCENRQVMKQQITKVAGVQTDQTRLIGGIKGVPLAVGEIL